MYTYVRRRVKGNLRSVREGSGGHSGGDRGRRRPGGTARLGTLGATQLLGAERCLGGRSPGCRRHWIVADRRRSCGRCGQWRRGSPRIAAASSEVATGRPASAAALTAPSTSSTLVGVRSPPKN